MENLLIGIQIRPKIKKIDMNTKNLLLYIMSHYRQVWIGTLSLLFLGLDFPKFKTGEELALKNFQNGIMHYNAREYSLSRERFLKAISKKRDFPLAKLYLARAYYQSGDWLNALQVLEELEKTSKDDPVIQQRLEILKLEISQKTISTKEKNYYQSLDGEKFRGFRFRNPVDIQVDKNGKIYLLAYGTGNLLSFHSNLKPDWVSRGGFARQMKGPISMHLTDTKVYVCDFPSDYLYVYDKKGNFLTRLGGTGSSLTEFRGPSGITRDDKGNFYIADSGNHRIIKWRDENTPLYSFGTQGEGKLNRPTGIQWFEGKIYVLEKSSPAVLVFDEEGNFLDRYTHPLLKKPRSIRFYEEKMVVADELSGLLEFNLENRNWERFPRFMDSDGQLRNLDRPFSSFQDHFGYVYAVDYNRNRVDIFTPKSYLLSNLNLEIEKMDLSNFPHVHIYFYVKNRKGYPIPGLDRKDLEFQENSNTNHFFELTEMKKFNHKTTISMVYENSSYLIERANGLGSYLDPFFRSLTREDRIELIRSGNNATRIMDYNVSKLNIMHSIRKSKPENNINSGKAIYLGLSNLSGELGPRALVYIASGKYPLYSKQFSFQRITQFAKANGIKIFPVVLDDSKVDDSWESLASATGGKLLTPRMPSRSLMDSIRQNTDYRYVLSYKTDISPQLKNRWIPISMKVKYRDFGGSTLGGYFVP